MLYLIGLNEIKREVFDICHRILDIEQLACKTGDKLLLQSLHVITKRSLWIRQSATARDTKTFVSFPCVDKKKTGLSVEKVVKFTS